jgi:hypothetical protein
MVPITTIRRLWAGAETLHAVTYFHQRCLTAMAEAGTKGFWMAYFVGRMAPLGQIQPSAAEAVAFGFSPERPARALPDGWGYVAPADALRVRAEAAAAALGELGVPDPEPSTLDMLVALRQQSRPGGHPLGAANRELTLAEDPRQRLWQLVTWLREQRGDEHVALWVARGFDGCEANVLTTAVHGQDPDVLRSARAWSPEDWVAAGRRLAARGLVEPAPPDDRLAATAAGRAVHAEVEERTDELSAAAYGQVLDDAEIEALTTQLERLAAPVASSDLYPSPNPMGLPIRDPSGR